MKRIHLALTTLAAIAAVAVSCQEKPEPDQPKQDDGLVLNGKIAEGITKTTVEGTEISWLESDEISAFVGTSGTKTQTNVLYVVDQLTDGQNAKFITKVKKVEEQDNYVALYPYSSASTLSGNKVSYTLPGVQAYVEGGLAGGVMPMIGAGTTKELEFHPVLGIFELALKADATITGVEIEGVGICGSVDINTEDYSVEVTSGSNAMSLTLPTEGVSIKDGASFCFCIPAGTYSQITYTVYDSEGKSMVAYDEDVVITRAKTTKALTTEYKGRGKSADLSDAGYANCYMVNNAGDYTFDAVIPDGTGKGTKITNGVSAELVWATSGWWQSDDEATFNKLISEIKLEDGKVCFTVPEDFQVGNVGVAVCDANKEIIYSYHIWITTRVADITAAGCTIMDRTLGACTLFDANSSNSRDKDAGRGLLFQWGRKDPLPGPRKGDSSEETAFTPGATTFFVVNKNIKYADDFKRLNPATAFEEQGYVHEATTVGCGKLPTVAIAGVVNLPSQGADWNIEANPCPFGYHVWKYEESGNFLKAAPITYVENIETGDCHFNINGAIFVRTGYRNIGNGPLANVGTDNRTWVTPRGNSTNANQGWWWQIGTGYTEGFKVPYVKPDYDSGSGAAKPHAGSIRCAKDQ